VYVCAPAPLQAAVATGLRELPPDYYRGLAVEYRRNVTKSALLLRREVCARTFRMARTTFGRHLTVARLDKQGARHVLLRKTGVACVPAKRFYHDDAGENLARFCYAKPKMFG